MRRSWFMYDQSLPAADENAIVISSWAGGIAELRGLPFADQARTVAGQLFANAADVAGPDRFVHVRIEVTDARMRITAQAPCRTERLDSSEMASVMVSMGTSESGQVHEAWAELRAEPVDVA